jgi:DNA-3-methyladenine glycosylase II
MEWDSKKFARQLRRAEKHLAVSSADLGAWIETAGRCHWVPQSERSPLEALVRAVAHQQLHGRAAEAILGRLLALFPDHRFPDPAQLWGVRPARLRSFGFSAAKVATIRALARAARDGKLPTREAAHAMSDEGLIEQLTAFRGIGRWTVEMMLIFTLGRMDIMPADDFGIRSGWMHLHQLESLPTRRTILDQSGGWQPYRSVAAWYLWRLADAKKAKTPN